MNIKVLGSCAAMLVATVLGGCEAASGNAPLASEIDAVMAFENERSRPGYAIGVVKNGELVFAKGYGVENIETGEAIDADTPFNLASLSKQFTGAAVALEIRKGAVDIDDRLAAYWPDIPEFMRAVTIGHLVYMTSGLPEYYTLPSPKGGWRSEDAFTVSDAIDAVFAAGALEYDPGTRWTYSNINYQLLAELTARLNETSFGEHMQSAVFTPLGMEDSWVDDKLQSNQRPRATSYVRDDSADAWREAPRLSPHYGGSGVFASLSDLAKWDEALFESRTLGDEFTDIMLSTKPFEHDKTNDAFGLVHSAHEGQPTVWYEGGDYGVSTYMLRLMDDRTTVICLANFGAARCGDKARAIADIIISD